MHKTIEFSNSSGKILSGILRVPDIEYQDFDKIPLVMFLHGFNEQKNSQLLQSLSYNCSSRFATFVFDFAGHGESQGDFHLHTINEQLDDIFSAIKFCETIPEIDCENIAFVGHNIGGDLGAISCQDEYINDRIKCFISLGSKFELDAYLKNFLSKTELSRLKGTGMHKGMFDINIEYLESVEKFDARKSLTELSIPSMLIYGLYDKYVKDFEARENFSLVKSKKELLFLETDHQFSSQEIIQERNNIIFSFLSKHLVIN